VFAALAVALPLLLLAGRAAAAAPENGWRLRLEPSLLFISTTDQLDPHIHQKQNDTADEEAELDRRAEFVPVFDVGYLFDRTATELYARTPYRSPDMPIAVGVAQTLRDGSRADLSFETALRAETWRDPFLTGETRKTTRLWNESVRLDWRAIAHTPLGLVAGLRVENPQNDDLGAREPKLARKGHITRFEGRGDFHVTEGVYLAPSAGYERGDMHGSAASWDGYRAALSLARREERFAVDASLSAVFRRYTGEDPLYERTREDGEFTASVLWTWDRLLGHEPLFADILAAYKLRDSNIDFLDAKTFVLGTGIGLRF
jgi:hypothetical protein